MGGNYFRDTLAPTCYTLFTGLVFLVSVVYSYSWNIELFVVHRLTFFIISAILIFFYALYILLFRTIGFQFNKIDLLVLCWFFYVLLRASFNFQEGTFQFLLLIGVYFSFRTSFSFYTVYTTHLLFRIFILVGIIQIIYGFYQYLNAPPNLHIEFNIAGSLSNSGIYAGFISLYIPFLLAILLYQDPVLIHSKYDRPFLVLMLLLGLFMLFVSYSRAAWLSTFVGICIILHFRFHIFNVLSHKKYKQYVCFSLFIVIIASVFYLYNLKPDSAYGRILIWKISSSMIKDNFLLGLGEGSFMSRYNEFQANYFSHVHNQKEFLIADSNLYAFNDFLQMLVEMGFVGFFLFLTLLGFVFYSVLFDTQVNRYSQYAFASMVSILVFSFFSYPFQVLPIYISFFFLLAIISSHVTVQRKPIPIPSILCLTIAVFLVFSSLSLTYDTNKKIQAYIAFSDLVELTKKNEYDLVQKQAPLYYDELNRDIHFLMVYANSLYMTKNYWRSIEEIQKINKRINDPQIIVLLGLNYKALKHYDKAIKSFIFASQIVPNRIYPKLELARIFDELQDKKNAKYWSDQILHMDVKVNSVKSAVFIYEARKIYQKNS